MNKKVYIAALRYSESEDFRKSLKEPVRMSIPYYSFIEGAEWAVGEFCKFLQQNFHNENNGKLHVVVSNNKHVLLEDLCIQLKEYYMKESEQ